MERLSIGKTNIFFGIFMVSFVGLSMLLSLILPASLPYWANMLVSEAVIIAPAAVLLIVLRIAPRRMFIGGHAGIFDVMLAYVGAYCLMPLIYFINFITMLFAENYVNGMVSELYVYPLWAQLVLMALLPAVVEEFIFRGIFYGSYRRKNAVRAALMSGLLFGITHLNLNQFAYAFAIGVAFCLLYEASGSIVLSMTAHFAINANTVFVMRVFENMPEIAAQEGAAQPAPAGLFLMAAAIFAAFAVLGLFFFALIIKKIAKRADRAENLKKAVTDWKYNGAEGKFLDVYMVVFIVVAFLYMIWIEIG